MSGFGGPEGALQSRHQPSTEHSEPLCNKPLLITARAVGAVQEVQLNSLQKVLIKSYLLSCNQEMQVFNEAIIWRGKRKIKKKRTLKGFCKDVPLLGLPALSSTTAPMLWGEAPLYGVPL